MLCCILETLGRGDGPLAMAQTVQCLKSLHEFSNNGEWKTSWPLTHMVDPLRAHAHGGTEIEMEAVLGWVKTQDDLRRKVLTGGKAPTTEDSIADDVDAEEAPARRPRPRGKPKPEARPKLPGTG